MIQTPAFKTCLFDAAKNEPESKEKSRILT